MCSIGRTKPLIWFVQVLCLQTQVGLPPSCSTNHSKCSATILRVEASWPLEGHLAKHHEDFTLWPAAVRISARDASRASTPLAEENHLGNLKKKTSTNFFSGWKNVSNSPVVSTPATWWMSPWQRSTQPATFYWWYCTKVIPGSMMCGVVCQVILSISISASTNSNAFARAF